MVQDFGVELAVAEEFRGVAMGISIVGGDIIGGSFLANIGVDLLAVGSFA